MPHVKDIKNKLDGYLKKNSMISLQFFSVKTIMQAYNYCHKSRLLYGMSCFVNLQTPMEKIESAFITGLNG
jgi:hypothetical protein